MRHDYNITGLLAQAEYVISDVSSAHLEALGLGKKVVICESAYMRGERDRKTELGAHEYLFQQDCVVIQDGNELVGALNLARPAVQPRREMLISNFGYAIPATIKALEVVWPGK